MLWKFVLSSIAFLMMPIWAMASLISEEEQCSVISKALAEITQNIFTFFKRSEQATVDEAQEYLHCDILGIFSRNGGEDFTCNRD